MCDVTHTPSSRAFWLSVVGIIGCFLIFAVLLHLAGVPDRAANTTIPAGMSDEDRLAAGLLTPAERTQRLSELRIKEDHALTSYQWVDKEKGVVRLPIDRAMELVVREAQAKK